VDRERCVWSSRSDTFEISGFDISAISPVAFTSTVTTVTTAARPGGCDFLIGYEERESTLVRKFFFFGACFWRILFPPLV
jgi:hypothetical protein